MNLIPKSIHRLGVSILTLIATSVMLLAQTTGFPEVEQPTVRGAAGLIVLIIELGAIALIIAAMWKIFTKASQPGWASIIPIYNVYILCKIAGRPGWWLLLFFVPVANIVIAFIVSIDLAKSFGKGAGFGVGLVFLPFVFYPILGFGDASYKGPAA